MKLLKTYSTLYSTDIYVNDVNDIFLTHRFRDFLLKKVLTFLFTRHLVVHKASRESFEIFQQATKCSLTGFFSKLNFGLSPMNCEKF